MNFPPPVLRTGEEVAIFGAPVDEHRSMSSYLVVRCSTLST